jgi:hypothetical protein
VLDLIHQIRQRNFEAAGQGFHDPEAHIFVTVLHLGNEDSSDTGFVGQVFLRPATLQPQRLDAIPEPLPDISLHTLASRVYDGLQHCLSATRGTMRFRHMDLGGAVRAYAVWAAVFLLLVFGAGFTFRQVTVAAIAVYVCKLGRDIWHEAYGVPPFNRIQFRFQLSLAKALLDSKIYTRDEIDLVIEPITEALPGKGWIFFTWLEPRLYFLNTGNGFSGDPEFSFSLKTFRDGEEVSPMQSLPDQLVFRPTDDGSYELVLISSEQRHSDEWPRPYPTPGTLLFKIPAAALWALQGKHGIYRGHEVARTHMEASSNLKYTEIPEIRNGWDYENEYGSFRWWHI